MKSPLLKHLATIGPVGFVPHAPGTAGTLCALGFVVSLDLPPALYIAITAVVTVVGAVASDAVERATGEGDPQYVVIDEFAGYMVSAAFLPRTWGYFVAAFILFRFFDILKPQPIRGIQRLRGGLGVMADDVLAGVLTNVILQIWRTQNWI